jgi:hypothetical protein
MGADIHMMMEVKTDEYGWVGVHEFPSVKIDYSEKTTAAAKAGDLYLPSSAWWHVTNRNYRLFGALAGVRHDGPAPKGLPEDMSPLAKMFVESMGGDGHSHTWYMLDEALPIFAAHICPEDLVGERRPWISNDLFGIDRERLADYRLIIFFDN